MAVKSLRIDADIGEAGSSADQLAELAAALQAALSPYTVTVTNDAAYSVGTSVDNYVIQVGTVTSADWAYRIIFDTGLANDKRNAIMGKVSAVLSKFTLSDPVFAVTHTAGNGTFQYEAAIT